jgi:hypothetical protein
MHNRARTLRDCRRFLDSCALRSSVFWLAIFCRPLELVRGSSFSGWPMVGESSPIECGGRCVLISRRSVGTNGWPLIPIRPRIFQHFTVIEGIVLRQHVFVNVIHQRSVQVKQDRRHGRCLYAKAASLVLTLYCRLRLQTTCFIRVQRSTNVPPSFCLATNDCPDRSHRAARARHRNGLLRARGT